MPARRRSLPRNQLTIIEAFKRAKEGRKCVLCQRSIEHSHYQRHFERCRMSDSDTDVVFVCEVASDPDRPSTSGVQRQAQEKFLSAFRQKPLASKSKPVKSKATSDKKKVRKPADKQHQKKQAVARNAVTQEADRDSDVEIVDEVVPPTPVNNHQTASQHSEPPHVVKERNGTDPVEGESDVTPSQALLSAVLEAAVKNEPNDAVKNEPTGTPVPSAGSVAGPSHIARSEAHMGAGPSAASSAPVVKKESSEDCRDQVEILTVSEQISQVHLLTTQQTSSDRMMTSQTTVATSSKRTLRVESQMTRKKARPSSPLPSQSSMFSDVDLPEVYDQLLTQLEDIEDANAWRPSQSNSQVPRNAASQDEIATPGRIHYSLRFMWRIVQRVLKSWDHPNAIEYWGDNLRSLLRLFTLPVPAQHLFMRVLMRRHDWVNPTKLNYAEVAGNLEPLFQALWNRGFMETSFCSDSLPLDECLKLLQQPDLQSLAKKFRLDHLQGCQTLMKSLLKHANQRTVVGTSVGVNVLQHAKRLLGTCYRINTDTWNLMTAIMTVYSPPMMDTSLLCDDPRIVLNQNLIFTMLQAETSKIQFPAPVLHKCTIFHPTLGHLMEYVGAKNVEQRMLRLMEKQEHVVVMEEAEKAKIVLEHNHLTNEEKMLFYRETPHFLRRYTAAWVLTRCVSWGFESAQKLRNYEEAVRLLKFLLETEGLRLFCTNSRGAWYDRLALNLSAHLKRMEESLDACNRGLHDPEVHARDGLLLQDRALKIANKEGLQFQMKIPIREPKKLTIKGRTIGKNLGDQRNNHFYTEGDDDGVEQVSVEIVALKHFTEHRNFKEGVHAEGSAWHALFGLLCYDIVFDHSVPGVWLSELQTHPSDLNSKGFYENRRERFDERFNDLATCSQEDLFTRVRVNYDLHFGKANSEVSWECFDSVNQIQRFLSCCPPALLTAVFRRLVMDYRHARSGFPDLTVWNDETGALAVVEVKGPGDRLSTKQRLWLNFFEDNGVEALVCHVEAQHHRLL